MTREELIETGRATWPKGTRTQRDIAAEIVDALVPLIRADLRAKVETLRAEDPHNQPVRDAYDAVLALLNGEAL